MDQAVGPGSSSNRSRSSSRRQKRRQKQQLLPRQRQRPVPSRRRISEPRSLRRRPTQPTSEMVRYILATSAQLRKLLAIFPHDTSTTDPVMKFLGGIEASGGMDNNINLDMVLDQRWALCAQRREPHTRPSIGRTVLQPPTLKKRARDVAQLHAQLSAVKRRLRSPSRAPIRLRSKGPPLFGDGGRRQAEARKRSRSGQGWWFVEQQNLHATTVATVAIDTGTELKVLDGLDVRAGVVVEIAHATDHEEGPKFATEAEERFLSSPREVNTFWKQCRLEMYRLTLRLYSSKLSRRCRTP